MKSLRRCGIALAGALALGLGVATAAFAQTAGERAWSQILLVAP